jgi:uncharacterized protein (DUF433 family)
MNGMSRLNRITFNRKQCGGKPCIRGMRIRVVDVIELMAAGLSAEAVVAQLRHITQEDVRACLEFAALSVTARPAGVR